MCILRPIYILDGSFKVLSAIGWTREATVFSVNILEPQLNNTIIIVNHGIAIIVLLALVRAEAITRQADIIAALTLEVLKGTTRAFDAGESLCNFILKCNYCEQFTFYVKVNVCSCLTAQLNY